MAMIYVPGQRAPRGFTLLTSIILSSVVLSLGIALLDVAYKQLVLASAARQSQYAFYAADAALECALFWDGQKNFFADPSRAGSNPDGLTEDQITCDDSVVAFDTLWEVTVSTTTTQFIAEFGNNTTCAAVTVQKGPSLTLFYVNGYNNCDDTDPRRVERGVKARF